MDRSEGQVDGSEGLPEVPEGLRSGGRVSGPIRGPARGGGVVGMDGQTDVQMEFPPAL
mgnify:CR=1 FL=1